jgi:hypothetical protein
VRSQFRIVDTAGQFDSAFTTDRKELRRQIASMHPVNSPPGFPDSKRQQPIRRMRRKSI